MGFVDGYGLEHVSSLELDRVAGRRASSTAAKPGQAKLRLVITSKDA
jgi:hypothetical protein